MKGCLQVHMLSVAGKQLPAACPCNPQYSVGTETSGTSLGSNRRILQDVSFSLGGFKRPQECHKQNLYTAVVLEGCMCVQIASSTDNVLVSGEPFAMGYDIMVQIIFLRAPGNKFSLLFPCHALPALLSADEQTGYAKEIERGIYFD